MWDLLLWKWGQGISEPESRQTCTVVTLSGELQIESGGGTCHLKDARAKLFHQQGEEEMLSAGDGQRKGEPWAKMV